MGPVLSLADVDLEKDLFAERVPHETFALLRREAPANKDPSTNALERMRVRVTPA